MYFNDADSQLKNTVKFMGRPIEYVDSTDLLGVSVISRIKERNVNSSAQMFYCRVNSVRILCFWYRSQQLCIQRGKTKSLFFTITNGVRQGGILSPKLFSVYMDDLSKMLNDSGMG